MMMIDQDRVKKVKDVELMERIFNRAKEIREEIRKKYFDFFIHFRVSKDGV